MKKSTKALLVATGLVGIPTLINHLIFKYAGAKQPCRMVERKYTWTHGDIRYVTAGEGEPLLLIHGIMPGVSAYEWENSIDLLAQHYKVYALDLLGFGSSDKPSLTYSSYLYTQLIHDFITDIIGRKTKVVANGTSAGFAVACANLYPKIISKLLLVSPMGAGTSYIVPDYKYMWLKRLYESPWIGTTIYNVLTSKPYINWVIRNTYISDATCVNRKLINYYYHTAHHGSVNAKLPVAAWLSNSLLVDLPRMVGKTEAPIHVLWGAFNEKNSVANLEDLKAGNENITATIFPNAKILPHVECPKLFVDACLKFFQ